MRLRRHVLLGLLLCLGTTAFAQDRPAAGDGAQTKYIALTFDDGPDDEATPTLLDVLKRHGARATFFPMGTIFEYAAPLYRIALTAFLPLSYDAPMPSATDAEAFGGYIADRMTFMDPQKTAEEALLTATQTPTQPGARRPRITRAAPQQ